MAEPGKILKFQQLCNKLGIKDYEGKTLLEDKKLGPRTRSCLAKMPILRFGSRGLAVRFVQDEVRAEPIDGILGTITKKCVMDFQRNKKIIADGIVGVQTWTAIITAKNNHSFNISVAGVIIFYLVHQYIDVHSSDNYA